MLGYEDMLKRQFHRRYLYTNVNDVIEMIKKQAIYNSKYNIGNKYGCTNLYIHEIFTNLIEKNFIWKFSW